MRRLAIGVAIASLTLVTGCGGDEPEETVESAASEVSEEAESAAPEESESETSDAAAGESTVLIGLVGTEEDPEAFEISLTDEAGEPVSTLPAGDYTIQVSDPSEMHNFHFMGGDVDESTSVPETEETTFEVTLEAGDYTYVCDPHPNMSGTLTVS